MAEREKETEQQVVAAVVLSQKEEMMSVESQQVLEEAKKSCDDFLGKLEVMLKSLDTERALLTNQRLLLEEERTTLIVATAAATAAAAAAAAEKERIAIPQSGVLKLDVGGEVFTTSYRTMSRREPDSVLASMFSNNNAPNIILDPQGRYFIDREGKYFGYILNYLRDGAEVQLPENAHAAKQLLHEAQFYKLKGLIDVLESHIQKLDIKKQASGEDTNAVTPRTTDTSPKRVDTGSRITNFVSQPPSKSPSTSPPVSPKTPKSSDAQPMKSLENQSSASPRAIRSITPPTISTPIPTPGPVLVSTPTQIPISAPASITPTTPILTPLPVDDLSAVRSGTLATRVKEYCELKPLVKAKHSIGVLCIQWGETVIATAGINSKLIDIWDFNSGGLIKSLSGHTGAVYCLGIRGNTLISGGSDGKYKVWDLTSLSCIRSKKAHVTLLCLKFDDELLVTAGIDAGNSFIKLWNVKDGTYLKAFAGHKESIWCVELCETRVLSGSHDCTVRVWDRKTGQCLKTLKAHTGPLRSLVAGKQIIVSGSEDGDIRVWDMETGELLNILAGHTKTVVALYYNPTESTIVSASFDGTVKVWDQASPNGACTASASCNAHGVYCFQLKENYVISGGEDGSIVLWH